MTIWRIIGFLAWAAVVVALLSVAALAKYANAKTANTDVFRNGDTSIVLTDTPCADLRPKWNKARYRDASTEVYGCYMRVADKIVFVFGDGDVFGLPAASFKPTVRPMTM